MRHLASAIVALAVKILGTFLAFGLIWLAARLLGSDDYAGLALVLSVVPIIALFGSGGRQIGFTRSLKGLAFSVSPGALRRIAPRMLPPALLAGGAAAALVWIARPRGELLLPDLLGVGVITAAISILISLSGVSRGAGRAGEANLSQEVTWRAVALLLLAAAVALRGDVNLTLILAILACGAVIAILQHLASLTLRSRSGLSVGDQLVQANRYHLFVVIVSVTQVASQHTDIIMLNLLNAPSNEIGAYFAALRVALAPTMMLVAANAVSGPLIARLSTGYTFEQFARKMGPIYGFVLTASLLYLVTLFLFSNFIMSLFGSEFLIAVNIMKILSFGFFINALAGPTGIFIVMRGEEKSLSMFLAFMLLIQISSVAIFFNIFGLIGAAVASMSVQLIVNAAVWLYILTKYKYDVSSINLFSIYVSGFSRGVR